MTMPVMEPDLDAATLQAWARVIDGGPFSSLCWGERIAFDNPECLTLLGALTAWTDRVRLVTTVVIPQLHDPVMLAKALATADMLSGGRLTVGIGVGGRHEDYHAVGADPATQTRDNVLIVQCHDLGRFLGAYGRHGVRSPRLDAMAAEGILLTRAHATAPLCSPALGSMYTGRYPHSHGLIRPVHQGWEYRSSGAHSAADHVRGRLVLAAFRYAARNDPPLAAGFPRVRRVERVLRIRRRASRRVDVQPRVHRRAVPTYCGILRSASAIPAGTVQAR
jgi:alkanesulfonate monooxygenase SsuD/methylene tetrahydromethanopterin reductase-like flavin-dependent oxidoreductase (luciferase family)